MFGSGERVSQGCGFVVWPCFVWDVRIPGLRGLRMCA